MRRIVAIFLTGIVSVLIAYAIIHWIAFPTLMHYPKLAGAMSCQGQL